VEVAGGKMAEKSASSAHAKREPEGPGIGEERKRKAGGRARRPARPVVKGQGGTKETVMESPRVLHGNALGLLIERHFAHPSSPCRSYSDLERRSGISREALSRYVTTRADRRRSPTIDTLATIADALHLSLEEICRAAAAVAKGASLPPEEVGRARVEVLLTLAQRLSDAQFGAVVELLRQMGPAGPPES
jgi:transcriptional regulator with XRE-family HTH domain